VLVLILVLVLVLEIAINYQLSTTEAMKRKASLGGRGPSVPQPKACGLQPPHGIDKRASEA
jgi:hypothetical protein